MELNCLYLGSKFVFVVGEIKKKRARTNTKYYAVCHPVTIWSKFISDKDQT